MLVCKRPIRLYQFLMRYSNKHLLDETESSIQFITSDKIILGEGKLSPILFCTGAINWMLDEAKSNKCFIIPKKSV